MDNYKEKEEVTSNKVRFSLSPEGKIEFDAHGLTEWEVSDAIQQISEQAREQRKATQKLKEITFTSEVVMHCLAFAFALILVGGASFTVSRVISGMVHSQHSGGIQNVR